MKDKAVSIVYKKEMSDIFRDRKTVFTSMILPVLIYIVMFTVMGDSISSMTPTGAGSLPVALSSGLAPSDADYLLDNVFAGDEKIRFLFDDDPLGLLQSGDALACVEVDSAGMARLMRGEPAEIGVFFDDQKAASSSSVSILQEHLTAYNDTVANAKLEAMGIALAELRPLSYIATPLSALEDPEKTGEHNIGNMILSMVLPMVLSIFLVTGAMATAVDLFAGEKERHTLEPLLCTRAGRGAILTGKYLAVTANSLLSTLVLMGGLALAYALNPGMLSMGAESTGVAFSFQWPALVLVIFLLVVMGMVFAGLHVLLSSYARNIKEASTYGSFLMLAAMIPSLATMYMQSGDFALWMMAVPVLNIVGTMKMVLAGVVDMGMIALALGCSLVFLLIVLAATRAIFKKESVLFRV